MYLAEFVALGSRLTEWISVGATVLATVVALALGLRAEQIARHSDEKRRKEQQETARRRTVALCAGISNELGHALPRLVAAEKRLDFLRSEIERSTSIGQLAARGWMVSHFAEIESTISIELPMTTRLVEQPELFDLDLAKLACALVAQRNSLVAIVRQLGAVSVDAGTKGAEILPGYAPLAALMRQVISNAYLGYRRAHSLAEIGENPWTLEAFERAIIARPESTRTGTGIE